MGKQSQSRPDVLGFLANAWTLVDMGTKARIWLAGFGGGAGFVAFALARWQQLNASAIWDLAVLGVGAGLFVRLVWVVLKAVSEQRELEAQAAITSATTPLVSVTVSTPETVIHRLLDDLETERNQREAKQRQVEALLRLVDVNERHANALLRQTSVQEDALNHVRTAYLEVLRDFNRMSAWYSAADIAIDEINDALRSDLERAVVASLMGRRVAPGGEPLESRVRKARARVVRYWTERFGQIPPELLTTVVLDASVGLQLPEPEQQNDT
jgi:hypothetical protein